MVSIWSLLAPATIEMLSRSGQRWKSGSSVPWLVSMARPITSKTRQFGTRVVRLRARSQPLIGRLGMSRGRRLGRDHRSTLRTNYHRSVDDDVCAAWEKVLGRFPIGDVENAVTEWQNRTDLNELTGRPMGSMMPMRNARCS